jgi:hypothetical protein
VPIKHKSWLENAFMLAVAGSIIALIGTLATTILPIMYGHEDISDFSITVDPLTCRFDVQNCTNNTNDTNNSVWVNIKAENFHKWLRPYKFGIHFQAISPSINDTYAYFDPQDISLPSPLDFRERKSSTYHSGKQILMPLDTAMVHITAKSAATGTFPIIIQGIGGDGRIRNATFYLRILSHEDYNKSVHKKLPILGDEIHH